MSDLESDELEKAKNECGWGQANIDLVIDGYPESLAKLLETDSPVPDETRWILASLLRGETKLPDMRGRKNSTLPPAEKRWIEEAIHQLWSNTEPVLLHLETIADDQGKEPLDIQKYIQKIRKEGFEKIASKFNISVHTVRQFCKPAEMAAWEQVFAGERNLQFPNGQEVDFVKLFGRGKSANDLRDSALTEARTYMKHPELWFDPLRYGETVTE